MRLAKLTPWRWNQMEFSRPSHNALSLLPRDIHQLFEGFFDDSPRGKSEGGMSLLPKADISETDQEYVVAVEMPGLKEEDIEVEFCKDSLRIRGEKRDERDEKQHNFHRVERSFGLFERVVPIPDDVNREQTQASYKNGVLTVTLPKAAAAAPQKIEVKPGA